MRIRILKGLQKDRFVRALEQRGSKDLAKVEPAVRRIVNDVRRHGDRALRRYAMRWDDLRKDDAVRVRAADLHDAWQKTPKELQDAITQAAGNIRRYSECRNRRSGGAKFSPEFVWDSWYVPWNRLAAMFPVDVIHCLPRC